MVLPHSIHAVTSRLLFLFVSSFISITLFSSLFIISYQGSKDSTNWASYTEANCGCSKFTNARAWWILFPFVLVLSPLVEILIARFFRHIKCFKGEQCNFDTN